MTLTVLDYSIIIIAFFLISMAIGVIVSRRAGESFSEYFLESVIFYTATGFLSA
jgi:hypothetical protein